MSDLKKPYCIAPWVHAHINVAGDRALCCEAPGFDSSKDQSLENYWNSEKIKEIRIKMLEGAPPAEFCMKCIDSKKSHTPKDSFNKRYASLVNELVTNTKEDGELGVEPIYFDYRISNVCNLSCRMCNAESSSKIEQGILSLESTEEVAKKILEEKKDHNKDYLNELLQRVECGEVKRLYWASGEAFFQKEHWLVIDKCIEKGISKEVELCYSTNFSYSSDQSDIYFEKLSKFKSVELIISVDSSEESVEFIRDGLKWNNFLRNLERLQSYPEVFEYNLNIVLTIPTMLNFEKFLKFLYHYKIPLFVTACNVGGNSTLLSPLALDKETMMALVNDCYSLLDDYEDKEYFKPFYSVLSKIRKDYQLFENDKKALRELFLINEELDNYFARQSLVEYYENFDLTNNWVREIITYRDSLEDDDVYWLDVLNEKGYQKEDTFFYIHNYQHEDNREKVLNIIHSRVKNIKKIVILSSAPTLLNKFLSKDNIAKFQAYYDLNDKSYFEKYSFLKLKKESFLGLFSFLFRNKKYARIGRILDFLFYPLSHLTSFHYIAELEIRREK